MEKYVYLCGCNNCRSLIIDSSPQLGSNIQTEKIHSVGFKKIKLEKGNFICPECSEEDITDDIKEFAKLEKNRTKLVKLINMLDINDDEEKFTLDNIKAMLLRDDVDPSIFQFLEGWVEVPTPSGRKLSGTETEKIAKHFNNYVFATHLSVDNKLYFGPVHGEHKHCDSKTLTVWGYITEENLNKIIKPKVVETKKPVNKTLNKLSWYEKLMKKIK
jgi:hypothetical protein